MHCCSSLVSSGYALRRVLPSAPLRFLPVFDERLLSWLQAALGVSPLRPGDGNPTMVPLRGEGVAGLSSVIVASLSSIIMQWLIVLVNGLVHTVQVIFSLRSKHIQVTFSLYMLNENICSYSLKGVHMYMVNIYVVNIYLLVALWCIHTVLRTYPPTVLHILCTYLLTVCIHTVRRAYIRGLARQGKRPPALSSFSPQEGTIARAM